MQHAVVREVQPPYSVRSGTLAATTKRPQERSTTGALAVAVLARELLVAGALGTKTIGVPGAKVAGASEEQGALGRLGVDGGPRST